MAQFRPPKFDNENEFRQKIIHTTLFVKILVRPWPTRSDAAANQVRAASKISAEVGGGASREFYTKFTPRVTGPSTNYFSKDIKQGINHLLHLSE